MLVLYYDLLCEGVVLSALVKEGHGILEHEINDFLVQVALGKGPPFCSCQNCSF